MSKYEVEILESSRTLNAKARIAMKDTGAALSLDTLTQDGCTVDICPTGWAILRITSDKVAEPYTKYIVEDADGHRYITGSESFWKAFRSIWDEMAGENEEYYVRAIALPSKNYKGKTFLSCSIIE